MKYLLSILCLFVLSCRNIDDEIILTEHQAINNLKEKCEKLKLDAKHYQDSDCECIANSISNYLGLRDVVGLNDVLSVIFSAENSNISVSVAGGGIANAIDRDDVDMITYEMSTCCECDSDLCKSFMVILIASFKENVQANDLWFYPSWFDSWCE